jgi:hypothetical protein
MILNSNVELDTNIHNTPPFPLRNLILDCYSNVFQSLIISTNHSIHFRYISNSIKSNGGCSSFFKYNHLPHLHMVTQTFFRNYQISQQRLLWPNQVAGCSHPLIKYPVIFLHSYSQHISSPLQVHWSFRKSRH